MKGLLIKDFRLNMKRKSVLVIFAALSVMMTYMQGGEFGITYMTMLCSIYAIGTISYDDMDNCMPFLLCLPISRKDYVKEKYLFCFAFGAIGWLFAVVLAIVGAIVRGSTGDIPELLVTALITIPIYLLILSLLIPIQVRYGAEKSRVVLMVLGGGVAVVAITFMNVVPAETALRIGMAFDGLSVGVILAILFVAAVIGVTVSYTICCSILEKKEY